MSENRNKSILVRGGVPLSGSVVISGSKNACLPIICASILSSSEVVLKNVPFLDDVYCMCELLSSLGAKCKFENGTLRIDPRGINIFSAGYEFVSRMRAGFLILGPLIARFRRANVPLPGGCNIGPRPVNEHLSALGKLGVKIELIKGVVEASAEKLAGSNIAFGVSSVGATENALMAAVMAEGRTCLENCAEEPEVESLIDFLISLGADVRRVGARRLEVNGVKELAQREPFTIIPDRIEAGTYILALAATRGSGRIINCEPKHMVAFIEQVSAAGVSIEVSSSEIEVISSEKIKPLNIITQPYPGFPTDLQPQIVAFSTQAEGVSVIKDEIFPQRFSYVPELNRMGARIELMGNSAIVYGSNQRMTGAPVEGFDIRGCSALVIAALSANGTSLIRGYEHLARGYENFVLKVKGLGGGIELVDAGFQPG